MTTALITGGGRGLGRSAALHLARAGVDVVVTFASREEPARAVAAEVEAMGRRARALPLDVRDTAGFPAFADALGGALGEIGDGRLDLLVNNGGTGLYRPFAETTEAEFDEMFAVHVKGVYFLTQALLPLLRDGGRVLNVSSGLTRITIPGLSAYATAKGAVETMTSYLARELGPRGISANVVAPGATPTDFGGGGLRADPERQRMLRETVAMGRVATADDIGALVASLLTSGSNWATGQRIEASGGQAM